MNGRQKRQWKTMRISVENTNAKMLRSLTESDRKERKRKKTCCHRMSKLGMQIDVSMLQ